LEVGEVLSGKSGDGSGVNTSHRRYLVGRMASSEEGDNVGFLGCTERMHDE